MHCIRQPTERYLERGNALGLYRIGLPPLLSNADNSCSMVLRFPPGVEAAVFGKVLIEEMNADLSSSIAPGDILDY